MDFDDDFGDLNFPSLSDMAADTELDADFGASLEADSDESL
jgi:hypothetical protein